MVFLLTELAQS